MDNVVHLCSRAVRKKLLVACALGCLFGCGAKKGTAENTTSAEAIKTPATVAEAAKILDLSTFPLMDGAKSPESRQVANLFYVATGDAKTAFEFNRKVLVAQGWKELPNTSVTEQSASAMFSRSGFVVSFSVIPNGDGSLSVRLQNQGNVKPGQLPFPPGAKPVSVGRFQRELCQRGRRPRDRRRLPQSLSLARLGPLWRRRGFRLLQTERSPRHRVYLVRTGAGREDHDPVFESANFG